jgi:restriction system protein
MAPNLPLDVDAAFELLLEEIEAVANAFVRRSAVALEARDFAGARTTVDRVEVLTKYRQKVDAVRREWEQLDLLPEDEVEPSQTGAPLRTVTGRLARGMRTREGSYYRPILQALSEMGGRAAVGAILERVGELMKPVLKDIDYQNLASDPGEPRWRNAAKWARNTLVEEGRLKSGSPHGVWEISEEGRQWLAQGTRPL